LLRARSHEKQIVALYFYKSPYGNVKKLGVKNGTIYLNEDGASLKRATWVEVF